MSQVAILGRQPALGLAELESLYGAEVLIPVGSQAARIELEQSMLQPERLGGTIKVGKLLTVLETDDWSKITAYLKETLPHHLTYIPAGKIKLGLSTYGLNVSVNQLNSTALNLKNTIKNVGRSSRIIANKTQELNTAQVIHGGLLSPTGMELVLVADGSSTILMQTHWVQDIDSYRRRDQERPKRDARVGMLPPKLAQIIINLAKPTKGSTLLDPFCGTGVVLQESLLQGLDTLGADLELRMVDYSKANLEWLAQKYNLKSTFELKLADATSAKWGEFDCVASETYLGRPLSSAPDSQTLQKIMSDCDTIHRKFLKNVARQTNSGLRMCIAVPAWHTKTGFKHLKTLDTLEELGYNRIKFVHVDNKDLIYHRPGQVVARELLVLTRK